MGCSSISADFSSKLAMIPVASFPRALENAYSYMEILVAGVSHQELREACLRCLIQDWEQYMVSSLVENEYSEMNELLNGVIITVCLLIAFHLG